MLKSIRHATLLVALIASLAWPALADVESDCRSDEPSRVVPACSELLQASARSVADRISVLDRRSRAHLELNAVGAAEADVNEIFKLDPNSPIAYFARGRVRLARSQNAAALADFNEGHLRAANKYEPLLERGRLPAHRRL